MRDRKADDSLPGGAAAAVVDRRDEGLDAGVCEGRELVGLLRFSIRNNLGFPYCPRIAPK